MIDASSQRVEEHEELLPALKEGHSLFCADTVRIYARNLNQNGLAKQPDPSKVYKIDIGTILNITNFLPVVKLHEQKRVLNFRSIVKIGKTLAFSKKR